MSTESKYVSEVKAEAHLIREGWKFNGRYYEKDGKQARIVKVGYFEYDIQVKTKVTY